ncbi:unnamed protein product, partial [Polarella glacialis]
RHDAELGCLLLRAWSKLALEQAQWRQGLDAAASLSLGGARGDALKSKAGTGSQHGISSWSARGFQARAMPHWISLLDRSRKQQAMAAALTAWRQLLAMANAVTAAAWAVAGGTPLLQSLVGLGRGGTAEASASSAGDTKARRAALLAWAAAAAGPRAARKARHLLERRLAASTGPGGSSEELMMLALLASWRGLARCAAAAEMRATCAAGFHQAQAVLLLLLTWSKSAAGSRKLQRTVEQAFLRVRAHAADCVPHWILGCWKLQAVANRDRSMAKQRLYSTWEARASLEARVVFFSWSRAVEKSRSKWQARRLLKCHLSLQHEGLLGRSLRCWAREVDLGRQRSLALTSSGVKAAALGASACASYDAILLSAAWSCWWLEVWHQRRTVKILQTTFTAMDLERQLCCLSAMASWRFWVKELKAARRREVLVEQLGVGPSSLVMQPHSVLLLAWGRWRVRTAGRCSRAQSNSHAAEELLRAKRELGIVSVWCCWKAFVAAQQQQQQQQEQLQASASRSPPPPVANVVLIARQSARCRLEALIGAMEVRGRASNA